MDPKFNRSTSVYTVNVESRSRETTLCRLIQRCPVPLAGSGTAQAGCFIRFRAADDEAAKTIAATAADDMPHRISTGYGVNQREVA